MEGAVVQKKVGVSQMLLATATHFNKTLTLWCVFGLFVIKCRLYRLFAIHRNKSCRRRQMTEVRGVSAEVTASMATASTRPFPHVAHSQTSACGSLPSFCVAADEGVIAS